MENVGHKPGSNRIRTVLWSKLLVEGTEIQCKCNVMMTLNKKYEKVKNDPTRKKSAHVPTDHIWPSNRYDRGYMPGHNRSTPCAQASVMHNVRWLLKLKAEHENRKKYHKV